MWQGLIIAGVVSGLCSSAVTAAEGELEKGFRNPPAEAQPWTYWFWINGNITKEGITADLEAMARVGMHGALIMEVASPGRMAPDGPVPFASPPWRALLKHAVAEAGRLGLEINLNNDAGWCGSGGPWNTPELSMQKLVWSSTAMSGPQRFEDVLPRPMPDSPFYRDIQVLAYPAPDKTTPPAAVPLEAIRDLSSKTNPAGKLVWDVPEGRWTVLRIGHTSTGSINRPAPKSGEGLECDKFNPEAMKRHFDAFLGRVIEDVGPDAGKVLTMTHIDSWEVGTQNWTPRMVEQFHKRRGYDLTPWLVALSGGPAVGSAEQTARFRWDFRHTQAELTAEAYAGALRELAHSRGLKLSIEGYGPNGDIFNPLTYGAEADVPMGEFWVMRWGAWHLLSPRLMASVGHASGKPVVGAESFTAIAANDSWTEHPYSIKSTGDWAFCEGINRFVFHRWALQPWLNLEPGMGFGPHGTHFDRTQTWFEQGAAFMKYLARCQFLLQRGQFVADVCRLVPDGENYGHRPKMVTLPKQYAPLPVGYNYDYVSDKLVMEGMSVQDGRLVLASGMSYRVMQLPQYQAMTPQLLGKIRDLVQDGAVVLGPRPERSPSLEHYPHCDRQVGNLATQLWGDASDRSRKQHALGAGRVIWGELLEESLHGLSGGPDFTFTLDRPPTDESLMSPTLGRGSTMGAEPPGLMPTPGLNWIHRRIGPAEVYFVANPQYRAVEALCTFRVQGQQPEFWDPATGEIVKPAAFAAAQGGTTIPIHFDPAGSKFVVFRAAADPARQVVAVRRNGEVLFGEGRQTAGPLPGLWQGEQAVTLASADPGRYELSFADGRRLASEISATGPATAIAGPWNVRFQPGRGAPPSVELPTLIDWSKHESEGIRYFSGTAAYRAQFEWTPPASKKARYLMDLGDVRVIAEVKLNSRDFGVLWKPPFSVDVTGALRPGRNDLEVKVTNLWPNRLIGDEQYPDDCTPAGNWTSGAIPAWPEWLLKGQPRPERRRLTFTTWKYYTKDSPLLPAGLLGQVTVAGEEKIDISSHGK